MADFHFKVDLARIAESLGQTREVIETHLIPEIKNLSISTHQFVLKYAQNMLKSSSWKLPLFLGEKNKNVRWIEITDGLWVVEIDDSAAWIEEGRPPTSMATEDWLLKPSKGGSSKWPKRAKDGSLYRPIPFTHFKSKGELPPTDKPAYRTMVGNAMERQGISKGIERNSDGTPKLGILHKLNITPPGPQSQFPNMYSRPRTAEEAALSGLKPHGGIFHLQGAVVLQRMIGKKKKTPVKETVVFRIVSSKHKAEGRWMYPKTEGIHSLKAAYEYAQKTMDEIEKRLQDKIAQVTG